MTYQTWRSVTAATGGMLACLVALRIVSGEPTAPTTVPVASAVVENPLAELTSLPYQPAAAVAGTVRLAGAGTLQQAAAHWCAGFARIHPDAACSLSDVSSSAGWKALVSGSADVALMSRPVDDAERAAAEKEIGRRIVVVGAAFDRLVWVVNAANPITTIPWTPEGGVLRPAAAAALPGVADPATAAPRAATTWNDLNGDAAWATVPIELHGTGLGSGTRWHMDRLLSGTAPCALTVKEHRTLAEVAEAVAGARGGLGLLSDTAGVWPGVKKIALGVPESATPADDHVAGSARPPDCRPLFLAVALDKDGGLPPVLHEFLAYVLSASGQLDAAKDGLLPLTRAEIHAQRELLGWPLER
jgi:ABC-type phosphate transport system substrate-binding protein